MLDKGFLRIHQKDEAGSVRCLLKPNDLFEFEAQRWLRLLVDGTAPVNLELGGIFLKRGSHTYDTTQPIARPHLHDTEINGGEVLSSVGETKRFRAKAQKQSGTPAFPNQIGYALGSAVVFTDSSFTPFPSFAAADFGLNQIGNVFGHPAGRRAFFNEPAIAPNGLGAVNNNGPLSLGSQEDSHYIYDVRILQDGDDSSVGPAAEYIWQRRPYWAGCYEAGAGLGDFLTNAASDTLATRFPGGAGNNRAEPGNLNDSLIPDTPVPNPTQVPVDIAFPTGLASELSTIAGLVSDEQDPQRIWMAITTVLPNSDVDAANTRSLWSWKSWTMEPPNRRDSPGQYSDESLTGFPSLATNVQFRDLKMSRAGIMFLACDGEDDDGGGGNDGALVAIDVTSGNEAVVDVFGETAGGIYTTGGLLQNNILAVAVDRSESYAASGFDRIWVLHRNGLSFADINNATKAIGAWTTVAAAGADINILDVNSIRGVANFNPPGFGGTRNAHSTFLEVDNGGDVYFLTTATAGTYDTVGVQRVNRLLGDGSAHSFYSVGAIAEGGAAGFIDLGNTSGSTKTVASLRMFRAEAGDPEDDVLWLATGFGGISNGDRIAIAIPLSEWGSGDNPGASYFKEDLEPSNSNMQWTLHVDRANNVILCNSHFNTIGILESFGRADFIQGEVDQFDAPAGGLQTIHRNTGTGDPWNARIVGKRIRIPAGQGTNAANQGSFIVDSFTDPDTIVIRNASGVSTGTGEAASWDLAGTEFDTFSTTALTIGSSTTGAFYADQAANGYVDDTGIGFFFLPYTGSLVGDWALNMHFPQTRQWDGGGTQWYRRRVEHLEAAATRPAHTTPEDLAGGVQISFLNQNAGVNEFFAEEFYTFGVSPGLMKDATQDITYGWDIYQFRSELVDDRLTLKTAVHTTALGGFINIGSLASVLTDNPFTGPTTTEQRHLATHQRQLQLDGNNNTSSLTASNGVIDASNGFQVGLDLGADTVAEKLKFCMGGDQSNSNLYALMELELYSATAAAGPANWSLRANFLADADYPEWITRADAFREDNGTAQAHAVSSRASEWIIDLVALAAAAGLSSPATNDAMRYWKVVVKATGSVSAVNPNMVGMVAFDSSGDPIGVPEAKRISVAEDTNYMANYIILATWLIDDDATAGGSGISSAGAVVTLGGGGTFSTDIGADDLLRELDGAENIVQEIPIQSRDSGTQLTLVRAPEPPISGAANWEVARISDVRPRDDEGASEDQPQFPASEFQVFICPVTGHILYHDDAVTNSRVLRVEKVAKVKRNL